MFWDTKETPSHNIEILLESADTKVEVFLDEDNIIQECKTHKKSIVNYFTRPEVIRRLIELITTEPPEEVPLSERFRHANVACEILTLGLPSLDEKLLADTDTLNMLYSYLENEPPLNPLLASFFSKTFSMFFTRKSDQDWFLYQQTCLKLLEYIKTKSDFLDLICKHFTTPIVPDLIMEMMHNVDGAQLKNSLFEWLNEKRLVEKLIEVIDSPEQSEKHANVADFLCDLIHQGRTMRQDADTFEPAFKGSNPILKNIESATTLFALFNVILQPNAVESAIVSGITVLLKIIKPVKVIDELNMERLIAFLEREEKIHNEFLTTVIRVIVPQLKHFNELLKNPPKKHSILTSAANLTPPFGMTRLQICRLFSQLLETKNGEIYKAICETDFLETLLLLFKEYCWNNFLHSEVEKCLRIIFPHASVSGTNANNNSTFVSDGPKENKDDEETELDDVLSNIWRKIEVDFDWIEKDAVMEISDSTGFSIQTHAIVNCKIISKLIDCWKVNSEMESAEKGRRLGYMGHLINIFTHITKCISESEHVGALIERNLDDSERNLWQSIVNATNGELTKTLNTQSKLLANYEPCDYNVSLDFTDNDISDAFNGLCTLMDSSDAFDSVAAANDDEGDEDDNVAASFDGDGGLSFYVPHDVSSFKDNPWQENDENSENMLSSAFANFEAYFGFNSSLTSNATEAIATYTNTNAGVALGTTVTTSEEYDNNANIEKSSSSWSGGDFTSFQIPKKDTPYTSNFVDDYEDDEGMWTKPLGASASTTTVDQLGTETEVPLANQTMDVQHECKTHTITNGPIDMSVECVDHVAEEMSLLNQLNNSIEDNSLVDQTAVYNINEVKEEILTEINNDFAVRQDEEGEEEEIEISKHKSITLDNNKTEINNTDTTQTTTISNHTDTTQTTTTSNHLTNTATLSKEISDDSATA